MLSTLSSTSQLICIKWGETGYYPSEWDTGGKKRNVELADELNENLGVTPAQRQAMEVGSLAGWDVPGADPKNYEIQKEEQIVKSSSRFARNAKECLETTRELKALGIGVCFEEQNIDVAQISGELLTAIFAMIDQEESTATAQRLRWNYRHRMQSGQFITCKAPFG